MTCVTLDIREGGRPLRQCRGCHQKKQIGRGAELQGCLPHFYCIQWMEIQWKSTNIQKWKRQASPIINKVSLMIKSSSWSHRLKHQSQTWSELRVDRFGLGPIFVQSATIVSTGRQQLPVTRSNRGISHAHHTKTEEKKDACALQPVKCCVELRCVVWVAGLFELLELSFVAWVAAILILQ